MHSSSQELVHLGGKIGTYLTANPMTIEEGRRAIAQAVSDNRVKVRGPRCPHVNPLAQQPFQFNALQRLPLWKMCLEIVVLTTHSHLTGIPLRGWELQ